MKKGLLAVLLAALLMLTMYPVVNAEAVFEITKQPDNIAAPIGAVGFTSVAAEVEGEITYRWYYKDADSDEWIDSGEVDEDGILVYALEGLDDATLYVPVTEESLGQLFMCVLTDEAGNVLETEPVTVGEGIASEITIETQPEDIRAKLGQIGTATVEITVVPGAAEENSAAEESEPESEEPAPGIEEPEDEELPPDAPVSYKWLVKSADTDEWQPSELAGCDTAEIAVPVTEETVGQQLMCLIRTADGGIAETDVISVQAQPLEISILAQPTDIRAKIGATGTATVEAVSAAELSYQWYFQAKGQNTWQASGFTGNKTATISVPVTAARIGQKYKCVISAADGVKVETDVVTVLESLPSALPSEIVIVKQPADIHAENGTTAVASVEAESEAALRYQWYFKAKNSTEWKPSGFEGAKGPEISVPVTAARLGQQYKCLITTDDGGSIETDVITVCEPLPSEIVIVKQPADIHAENGTTAVASVEAESAAALRYQWYFKAKNSTEWKPSGFEGAKSPEISVPVTAARLGQQYKCLITTDDGGSIETDVITVCEPLPSVITIVSQPADIQAKLGADGFATVLAQADTGAALSYQWYFKAKNGSEWKASGMTGSKTNTICVPVTEARLGQQYKCVITAKDGGMVETDAVTVCMVSTEITVVSQPAEMYAALGSDVTATVKVSADSAAALSYQWYFKAKGGDTWNASGMSGSKTATITVPVTQARLGQQYKCVITSKDGGRVETNAVTIRDNAGLSFTITRNPDSYRAYEGAPVELDVSAGGRDGLSYQWYKDNAAVEGATDSKLYFSAVTAEDAGEYYCEVRGFGYTEISRTGTVRVLD